MSRHQLIIQIFQLAELRERGRATAGKTFTNQSLLVARIYTKTHAHNNANTIFSFGHFSFPAALITLFAIYIRVIIHLNKKLYRKLHSSYRMNSIMRIRRRALSIFRIYIFAKVHEKNTIYPRREEKNTVKIIRLNAFNCDSHLLSEALLGFFIQAHTAVKEMESIVDDIFLLQ